MTLMVKGSFISPLSYTLDQLTVFTYVFRTSGITSTPLDALLPLLLAFCFLETRTCDAPRSTYVMCLHIATKTRGHAVCQWGVVGEPVHHNDPLPQNCVQEHLRFHVFFTFLRFLVFVVQSLLSLYFVGFLPTFLVLPLDPSLPLLLLKQIDRQIQELPLLFT